MAEVRQNPKPAVTPRQWATIGLLAVVLVGVLWWQFGASEPGPGDAKAGPAAPSPASPVSTFPAGLKGAATGQSSGTAPSPPWPTIPLAEAAAYDPFQPLEHQPASTPPLAKAAAKAKTSQDSAQRRARQDQLLAALRKTGTTAVLRGPQGAMAIVGRRTIRVGDELDGFRVVAIEPDGVVLKPATPEKRHEDPP